MVAPILEWFAQTIEIKGPLKFGDFVTFGKALAPSPSREPGRWSAPRPPKVLRPACRPC
jgi:hypothetical protein